MAVRAWLAVLIGANMVAPLAFFQYAEARVVFVTLMASATIMMVLTGWLGFNRLLGLGHVLWVPLLVYLIDRLEAHPPVDAFGLWLRLLVAVDAVSLIIDTIDIVRYVRGERGEMVEGL